MASRLHRWVRRRVAERTWDLSETKRYPSTIPSRSPIPESRGDHGPHFSNTCIDSTILFPLDSVYRTVAWSPAKFWSSDASTVCQPRRMRVVEATENCAAPEEVESDNVRLAASYLSMMPR